jgi:hypothetical protein
MVSLAPRSTPLIEVLTSVAAHHLPGSAVDAALSSLDSSVRRPLGDLPAHQRTRLINQFVRGLKGLSVHDALRVERELLDRADCAPAPRYDLAARDGLSMIALRNHVRYIAVYAGLDWSDGMLLQSAFSELARLLQQAGGAEFSFRATDDFTDVSVDVSASDAPSPSVRTLLDDWKRSLPSCLECTSDARQRLQLHLVRRAAA